MSSSNVSWHGSASSWKWTRHPLMYCVRLRRWARHQQPVKYLCAAMTQQPASTYTLRRADCSIHPFRMSRLGVSYLLQGAYKIWPMQPRSPFVYIFLFKTKFPLIPGISFNIRSWLSVPFPPLRLPEILIWYQCSRHIGFLTARLPAFLSRSNPGLIFSLQEISNLIRPMRIVSKYIFRLYLKYCCYTLFVIPSKVASP